MLLKRRYPFPTRGPKWCAKWSPKWRTGRPKWRSNLTENLTDTTRATRQKTQKIFRASQYPIWGTISVDHFFQHAKTHQKESHRCPSQRASGALRGQCAVVLKGCSECDVACFHSDGENKQRLGLSKTKYVETILFFSSDVSGAVSAPQISGHTSPPN